jgi:hypothetical protein
MAGDGIGHGNTIHGPDGTVYVQRQAYTASATVWFTQVSNSHPTFVYYTSLQDIPPGARIVYKLINLQLSYWTDAKRLFSSISDTTSLATFEHFDKIILYLGMSLSKLFGRNWTPEDRSRYNTSPKDTFRMRKQELANKGVSVVPRDQLPAGYTPSLLEFVAYCYPLSKGWDLYAQDASLFLDFAKLNACFNNNVKHYEDAKEFDLFSLDVSTIRFFMRTARNVWLWFLQQYYHDSVPHDLLSEFGESYSV